MPSPITPAKLAAAIDEGYRALEPHRRNFTDTVIEYGGQHFGTGDGVRRPINLIAQAGNILVPNLISDVPKHRVRSPIAQLRGEAAMLELALDRVWEDTDALNEVRQAVLDAILGPLGIIRMGMRAGKDFVTVDDNQRAPVSEPFCRRISIEDYSCDPAARNRREMRWEAIRYRMPRDEAIESGIFGRDPEDYGAHAKCTDCGNEWDMEHDMVANLPGEGMTVCPLCGNIAEFQKEEPIPNVATREEAADILRDMPNLEHKHGASEEVGDIGKQSPGPDRYSLIDTIELWDVFLYTGDGTYTITMPASHDQKKPALTTSKYLLAERWQGPDPGPLVTFGFCDMPDQPLFKPVVADYRDLHDFLRVVSSKLARESENSKVVHTYTGESEDDAMSVKNMADSGLVRITSKDGVGKIEVVGIIKELMPILDWAKREAADATGNLPLVGGQDSAATDQTATAAQYLQANSSQKISAMRQRVDAVLRAIDRHFGWWLTTDPMVKKPLPYRVPGGETVTLTFDAATRRGDFLCYDFDIERYSSVGMEPNVRLKRVVDFLGLVTNLVPLIQAGAVSMEGLANIGRQEFGLENLDELLPAQAPGLQAQEMAARQGIGPSQGTPQQTPGMNPAANNAGSPAAAGGQQTTPANVARSVMAA